MWFGWKRQKITLESVNKIDDDEQLYLIAKNPSITLEVAAATIDKIEGESWLLLLVMNLNPRRAQSLIERACNRITTQGGLATIASEGILVRECCKRIYDLDTLVALALIPASANAIEYINANHLTTGLSRLETSQMEREIFTLIRDKIIRHPASFVPSRNIQKLKENLHEAITNAKPARDLLFLSVRGLTLAQAPSPLPISRTAPNLVTTPLTFWNYGTWGNFTDAKNIIRGLWLHDPILSDKDFVRRIIEELQRNGTKIDASDTAVIFAGDYKITGGYGGFVIMFPSVKGAVSITDTYILDKKKKWQHHHGPP